MNGKSNPRTWAFWGGLLGLLTTLGHLKSGDGILINSIELIIQAGGFAVIGAVLAYIRNRIAARK
jgi:hypothetical protein